jgi:hypothetical protein
LEKRFESRALLGMATPNLETIQHVAAAIVARAHALSLSSVVLVPVDEQTDARSLAVKIDAVTSSMGVTVGSMTTISALSASDLISSNSGMIALASRGLSLTDDIVATWSVLENAQRQMLGVILTDSRI